MEFQCTKCGACCRRAGLMGLMPQREDGACIHLEKDNTCKIYESRPEICRVDKMFERNKDYLELNRKEYYKLSNSICNTWIEEDGLSKEYLINISKYDE